MQSDNLKRWPTPANPNQASRPKHTTISGAARYLLEQPVPGDRLGRTHAEVIASALISRAVAGDVRALRLILEMEEPGDAETQQT